MRPLVGLLSLLLICASAQAAPTARWTAADPPRLAVVIVIDQFRADYLSRFRDRFGPDGFRRFLERGAVFPNAEYQMMQCMTGPGHSVVLSGAWPAQTGIPLNDWYDTERGAKAYCVQDPATPALGGKSKGTSPANMRAPTLGDALKNAGLPSKVLAVSHKDRAAILMGGFRADQAVWMDRGTVRWMSSDRYRPKGDLPAWVQAQNRALAALKGKTVRWAVTGPGGGLSEQGGPGELGRWTVGEDPAVIKSPWGMERLVDAALAGAVALDLGGDAAPDLLAVSFSVFDMVGHEKGPNHRAMESMAVAADRALARLFKGIEARVPAAHVVYALTGDHGVAPSPEYGAPRGLPTGRLDEAALARALEAHLSKTLGRTPKGGWVKWVTKLNIWLADDPKARAEAAAWARRQPGIRLAFTRDDVAAGRLPPAPDRARILNQYVPGRSGDVVALPQPFVITGSAPAVHQSGHSYDRMVPLAFAGAGIKPGVHPGGEVVDLAPTLAWLLGVLPPALSQGRVLREALAD